MDYLYENLGDERFQEFCQALLVKEHPGVQCFPIGQPDGGRDATVTGYRTSSQREVIVYQVKFVRNPNSIADPHKWLVKVCEGESPKIKNLVNQGVIKYYILTNIRGTGHPEVGSIDRLQKVLDDNFDIPAQCLWRDDLSRRLEGIGDLKWSYPELMSGIDAFKALLETSSLHESTKCIDVIKAFALTQLENDKEVKFRQVELQNNLFDLFVDAPLERFPFRYLDRSDSNFYYEYRRDLDNEPGIGAVAFLLSPVFENRYKQIVLLGGPGQGKSTLTQFLCQVYRLKLLNYTKELELLPENLRPRSLKIPFRVDLRDLAMWLKGQNPFRKYDSQNENEKIDHWESSLESFLAAQVRYSSGGADFSIHDLRAVAKSSALLLVFDGLDEVAEISLRKEIVKTVEIGVKRLRLDSASLHVIVTTRPSAFSNSPGFPEKEYRQLRLGTLNRKLINEYANKWIEARRIDRVTAAEVRSILKNKIEQPHLRDLANNPMQLAILLSLIHSRGASLPDKRTALYDSYVELFFNRESEKSTTVRAHRDVLEDMHRYIAYVLHSEAEKDKAISHGATAGRITSEKLRALLYEYLEHEGHDTSLVELLFRGVVDRVVFLVSRVEGTFEFEIQPLREYFVAKYLYLSAPYSPPGREKKGTKPDRFDAISRNFYWLNVTRFFAGCFSKGELPTLIDRLEELISHEGYKYISHPRILTANLLSDWVFNQHPKSQVAAIKLVLDGIGLRNVLSSDDGARGDGTTLTLTDGCGREQLVEECFAILKSFPALDYAVEIISLMKANSTRDELLKLWQKELKDLDTLGLRLWVTYGHHIGLLRFLPDEELMRLISQSNRDKDVCSMVLRTNPALVETDSTLTDYVIDLVLNGDVNGHSHYFYRKKAVPTLVRLIRMFDVTVYTRLFEQYQLRSPFDFFDRVRHIEGESDVNTESTVVVSDKLLPWKDALDECEDQWKRDFVDWTSNLQPWDAVIEETRTIQGTRWVHYQLSIISSAVGGLHNEAKKPVGDLFDESIPLVIRSRGARFGAIGWWQEQLDNCSSSTDLKVYILGLFFSWANTAVLKSLKNCLSSLVDSLSDNEWNKLSSIIDKMRDIRGKRGQLSPGWDMLDGVSARVVTLVGMRCKTDYALNIYSKFLIDYSGSDVVVQNYCVITAIRKALLNGQWAMPYGWYQKPITLLDVSTGISCIKY